MTKGWLFGWGWAIAGELVGKPPIAHEFHRIPYNFLIFATFASIHGLFSVQQAYVRGFLACNKHMYMGCSGAGHVHALKNGFLSRASQQ
jgi:hypothetical protein